MKAIDIVVPIYNAYEFTEECIKSIIKNTDLKVNSLLLINDKSPDEKILPMLQKYKKENEELNIEVLNNEENIGFVRTVNKGMKYSENDVVLLNSDTEVTKDWLEKIQKCAYSNEYIATVTPLTNNGTIASVPNFGIDNELPKNMTLEEYAEMIEKISKNRYPELTTGNGFCLYIKREVINQIGVFDEKTFGKGYGEENDFCYRALDNGYSNVLCDNTFIYHKGTQSFKKENLTSSRQELIENHMRLLREKHPIYVEKTDQFLAINPLKDIQENINININIFGKKRILYLVNEWEENMQMTGGTSLHIKDLILENNIKNIASFVLAPDKGDLSKFKLFLYTQDFAKEILNFKTDIFQYGQIHYTNNSYKEMLKTIFKTFKFDILHVHHFLFQTFDAIDVAKENNIYSIITLHDLYMSCPSINMVYRDKFCDYDKEKDCAKCLKARYGLNSNALFTWRKVCEKVLKKFDKIIVPSENTRKQFEKVYKNLNIDVVEHGVDIIKIKDKEKEKEKKNTFDIAFVGAMAIHKGSNILRKLIKESKNPRIKIHLFGKSEDKVLQKNTSNYINHGPYKRGELPKLLNENNIDLVCMFATWPETYSYTLTESYMAKIPVLTFDIGAVGDRVKQDKLGYIIKFEDSNKILEKIEEIIKNEEEYKEIKTNFEKYKFKTMEEMQEYYQKMYNEISQKNEYANMYQIFVCKDKSEALEFNFYKANYTHLINRYETMRKSKFWEIAKKVKRKIKHK